MNEKTIVITETDGKYQIQNNGVSEYALIGILECVLFDLKSANHNKPFAEQAKPAGETKPTVEEPKEKARESIAPDLRTRIGNAIKAINALGGEIEHTDLINLTDEELQAELDELTNQYKRLKGSKTSNK